jgi:glycosyltransferase involved in cell wall biosynthesis
MKESENQKILGVFFSYGVGVSTWKKQGMLSREISLYEALAGATFEKVYFFTYTKEDPVVVKKLSQQGIFVKQKKYALPNFLYSIFLPIIYKKEMRECAVYKTTQIFGSWSAVFAKWLYKKPLLVRAGFALSHNLRTQTWLAKMIAKTIEVFSLFCADAIVVTTESIKDFYTKYAKKITVIPNFVDTDLFAPSPKFLSERINLLFVGRLSPEKNIGNLIFAIKDILGVDLTLVGEGESRRDLEDLAQDAKAQIHFVGAVDHEQLPQYFAKADIFVLSSLFEGHPKVLVEAMAAGLPIVGTDVRGINTLIKNGKTGILTGTQSSDIRAAIEMLKDDPQLRASLGQNARQEAEREFSFHKIIEAEKNVYQRLLKD